MTLIEQAIFTSAHTDRAAGYQVAAQSPNLAEADARELATWCPSHDSLLESGPEAASFNFHPLPSGAYCVSRTVAAGAEYSGRRGPRVYTHCLIVPPDALARFSNNPFAVLRAALAIGALEVQDEIPRELEPLQLAGRAAAVDTSLLARLAVNPGARWMATLVQAAIDSPALAISGESPAVQLIAGLINCLPPECRTEFSFATGLKFSSQRPYRLLGLSNNPPERRRIERQQIVDVLDVTGPPPADCIPLDGWSDLIYHVLESSRTAFLATQFSKRRFELSLPDLPVLGLQLLEELDATKLREVNPTPPPAADLPPAPPSGSAARTGEEPSDDVPWDDPLPDETERSELAGRAHAAHRRFAKSRKPNASPSTAVGTAARQFDPDSPEVLQKLELLDDVVFEAIGGDAASLEQLATLWPEVRNELGTDLLAESREQYLRYALSIWEECLAPDGIRKPAHAAAALDVLCILFDE